MAFTAIHPERGRIDATSEDLGCGWDWAGVHRSRPRVPLSCPACRHPVHAKTSKLGLRYFAHDPGAPRCALSGESMEHHLLKLELAVAVRAAGHHAELEVRAPDGTWRADVLATTAGGSKRIAWEAQLSSITVDEIRQRTDRYLAHEVAPCWVTTRAAHWLGQVPSIRVRPPEDGVPAWRVSQGLARFAPLPDNPFRSRWQHVGTDLQAFVDWTMSGRITTHLFPAERRIAGRHNGADTWWTGVWTAAAYVAAEADYARSHASEHLIEQRHDGDTRRREDARRRQEEAQRIERWNQRTQLVDDALDWLRAQGRLTRDDAYAIRSPSGNRAGATAFYVNGILVGLLRPQPEQVNWNKLTGVAVFVRDTTERQAVASSAPADIPIVVLPHG